MSGNVALSFISKSGVHCTWSAAADGHFYDIIVRFSYRHRFLLPAPCNSTFMPSVCKAFVVGPGYAPIPAKLVTKITSGVYVELADLLAENLREQKSKPHTYLDEKLVVSPARKRVVEITDILTWVKAFTIHAWVFCNAHPNCWQDLTQYKLLITQTVRQFPGPAW